MVSSDTRTRRKESDFDVKRLLESNLHCGVCRQFKVRFSF